MGLKVGLGLALGSTALFADGIHSLSDLATDLVTLGG
ncbi:cation transporter, partial [Candidatus Bipolaricaulota bacterium]|nr:cation transporter [Candidatus Bipolaricaulota bacterium]